MLSRAALQRLPPSPSPQAAGDDPQPVVCRALSIAAGNALGKPLGGPEGYSAAHAPTASKADGGDLALQDRCFLTRLGQYSQLHCSRPETLPSPPPSLVPLPDPFAPARLPPTQAQTFSLQCLDTTFLDVLAGPPPRLGRNARCRTVFEAHSSPQGALALQVAGRPDLWLGSTADGALRCVPALDDTARFAPQWDGDVLRLRTRTGQCVTVPDPITGHPQPFAAVVRATPLPPSGYAAWLLQSSPHWVAAPARLLGRLAAAVWRVYGAPLAALRAGPGPARDAVLLQRALDDALRRGERQEAVALSTRLEQLRQGQAPRW
eukprot:EG_transcript_14260